MSRPTRTRGATSIRDSGRYALIALQLTSDYLYDSVLPDGRKCHRIYFTHVRKTGGTSLYKSFLSLGGEDPAQVLTRMNHGVKARSGPYSFACSDRSFVFRMARYNFGWSHLPAWQLHLKPGTFTVSILRDPISRVISLFRHLADERADEGERFHARADERAWAADGFATFLDQADRVQLLNQLYAFSSRFDPVEAAERIRGYSLYFFSEHYNEGVAALANRLGLPLAPRVDRVSVAETLPTGTQVARLREILDPEYKLLDLLRVAPGPGFVGTVPPRVPLR